MIRPAILSVLLLSATIVFCQDTVNRNNSLGHKDGFWWKTDKDGHKLYEGHFNDGAPSGEFRYYYPDGKIKTIAMMSADGQLARTVTFSENGRKIASGNYQGEKKDSIWRYYSEYDGVLLSEESYSSGLKEGISKTYYTNCVVAEVVSYKSGKKEGEWIQYFDDGKLKFRGSYVNDEKDGPFFTYFPDGKTAISGSYQAGHKDGVWTFYEENGKVSNSEKYDNGALIIEKKP